MIQFDVPGIAQPQGSKSVSRAGRCYEANRGTRPWRDTVTWHALQHQPKTPLVGPVSVSLQFRFPRPRNHYRKDGSLKPSVYYFKDTKDDLDKLCRSILDSLTDARIFHGDQQVAQLIAVKMFGEPGVLIAVKPLVGTGV